MSTPTADVALIIAAGMGTRVSHLTDSKPMLVLQGYALIERTILSAKAAGAQHFVVVSGYNGDILRAYLDDFALREQLHVNHVVNDEYRRANGLSVYKAAKAIHEPFFLLMADHVFDPGIMRDMSRTPLPKDGLMLAVDYRLNNPYIDLNDVTKVAVEAGKIYAIGKDLATYNAYDTGIFLCTSALFRALEESMADGDDSLSGGVRRMAAQGKAIAFDIGNRFWIDVDDEDAYTKAKQALATVAADIDVGSL